MNDDDWIDDLSPPPDFDTDTLDTDTQDYDWTDDEPDVEETLVDTQTIPEFARTAPAEPDPALPREPPLETPSVTPSSIPGPPDDPHRRTTALDPAAPLRATGAQHRGWRERLRPHLARINANVLRKPPTLEAEHAQRDLQSLDALAKNAGHAHTITRALQAYGDPVNPKLTSAARNNIAHFQQHCAHFLHRGSNDPTAKALLDADPHIEKHLKHFVETSQGFDSETSAEEWLNLYTRHLPLLNACTVVSRDRTLRAPLQRQLDHDETKRRLGEGLQRSGQNFHAGRRQILSNVFASSSSMGHLDATFALFSMMAQLASPAFQATAVGSLALSRFAFNPVRHALRTHRPAYQASATSEHTLAVQTFIAHLTDMPPRARALVASRNTDLDPLRAQRPERFRNALAKHLDQGHLPDNFENYTRTIVTREMPLQEYQTLKPVERLERLNDVYERATCVEAIHSHLSATRERADQWRADEAFAASVNQLQPPEPETVAIAQQLDLQAPDPDRPPTLAEHIDALRKAYHALPQALRQSLATRAVTPELQPITVRKDELQPPAPTVPPSQANAHEVDFTDVRQLRWLRNIAQSIDADTAAIWHDHQAGRTRSSSTERTMD